MKFLVILAVTLALVGCAFGFTEGLFEERKKAEDRSEIVAEDRVKDVSLI